MLLGRITSLIKKCLFGKQIFEYALEYLESFLETYYDYNKMFLFEAGEGHEPTGQIVGYLDNIFYNFLSKLYSKNFLSNTTIILFSDHGQHLNGPSYLFKSKDFLYERTLPLLFLIIPNTQELYEKSLYEIIKINQQVFITPYDIYYTLIHIALGAKFSEVNKKLLNNIGESLLTKNTIFFETGSGCSSVIAKYYAKKTLLKPINYSLRY